MTGTGAADEPRSFIAVRGLTHRYPRPGADPVLALDGVDLAVGRGEYLGVVGANGSGKSTLAKHLNGLLQPTAGEVLVDGLDTRDPAALVHIRRTVGMVFQNPDNQIVATTVEEDVAFGPENLGVPPAEIRARVDEALFLVGLADLRERPPHLLSGGQKQRLAIAGALAMRPACLVLDEATAMLDPRGRAEVLDTVRRLNAEEGITVVHITHFLDEVVELGRLVILDRGRVAFDGPPAEAFGRADLLERVGLELPPVAALAARLRRAGLAVPPDALTVERLLRALLEAA